MAHHFKQLLIRQKSMDLTDMTYAYNKGLPNEERFNLIDEMNRCSCSIPSNIAEGSGKRSKLQFAEFLSTSLASSYELETQLLNCERRKYGTKKILDESLTLVNEIQKMIYTFREKIINS